MQKCRPDSFLCKKIWKFEKSENELSWINNLLIYEPLSSENIIKAQAVHRIV